MHLLSVLILTDNVTIIQFQFPLPVCFYSMVELEVTSDYRFETFVKE